MCEVVIGDFETTLDLPPDRILEAAVGKMESVLVIGWVKEDGGLYLGSSSANKAEIIFLLERVKHDILNGEYG